MAGKDVVIICEAGEGQTESANMRLIASGAALSSFWGSELICLLAGGEADTKAAELCAYVDHVYVARFEGGTCNSSAFLDAARQLVAEVAPRAVLFGHTFLGMDLAPRIAAHLGVAPISNCASLVVEADRLFATRPMYHGRIHAKVEIGCNPVVATLQSGNATPLRKQTPGVISEFAVAPDSSRKVRHLKSIAPERTGLDISKAEILVAGGRGIGERDNFVLVENLAAALGGAPACSRPLVDMGWFGPSYQVGMSGNSVKPRLYVACGISGAIEHLHGMKESETIVAINKDPDAPIFKVAHFGIVGDVNEVLPELTDSAKRLKP